ncbi:MAG: hypothetical protein D6785_07535, partial [Planctomycetota bacterium]
MEVNIIFSKPSFLQVFRSKLIILMMITLFFIQSCCSLGQGPVNCSLILSRKTPRQCASFFKCALLYDSQGMEKAYACLSQNTQKRIPYWKFKYGFSLIDYDKNPELKLWEVLANLNVDAVEKTSENEAVLICTVNDEFAKKHNKSYSEFIYMKKEGEEWKLDLERTMQERGVMEGLDNLEKAAQEGKTPETGGGCALASNSLTPSETMGWFLPFFFLVFLLWIS